MLEQQNTYNQQMPPQMGQGMMPPPIPPRDQWQRRAMNAIGRAKSAFPNWLSQYAISVYIVALALVSVMYSSFSMPWYYMLSGVMAVTVFFLYGGHLAKKTSILVIRSAKIFERRIFIVAFLLRIFWMLLIYSIFMQTYGDAFGFDNADAQFYHDIGVEFADAIRNGNFKALFQKDNEIIDVSDLGYASYVGFVYSLTSNNIIILRLLKCILSACTVLLINRLACRNFGQKTARISAIFCALWPNFWYYCGTHLKETEMVFLAVLFVEQADQMLRSRQFTAWKVIPVLLIAAAMFTFRTPLAIVALLALIFSVVMSSSKVVKWGKRIIVGGLAVMLIGVTMGNRIKEQAYEMVSLVQSGNQQSSIEEKMNSEHGNVLAKYAGSAVFAPLIFSVPFPTMVRPYDGQEVQQLLNGGNAIKSIMSGFVIFALVVLLLSGDWRNHLLPLSFMLGYLVVLTMSSFAHSERFHQPAMPFEFMFAAYGLSMALAKLKYKRWFTYWCGVMFVCAIVWNWFKLAGRGLV